ncbi:MAG: aminotransferase class V-fold PLP-dependent enzyme, partial [bacterium]
MTGALEDLGGAAGRGTHAAARAADAIRGRARSAAARVLGREPARVALVPGATFGLNVAIHGLVRPGWHVIATAADHNATLR